MLGWTDVEGNGGGCDTGGGLAGMRKGEGVRILMKGKERWLGFRLLWGWGKGLGFRL